MTGPHSGVSQNHPGRLFHCRGFVANDSWLKPAFHSDLQRTRRIDMSGFLCWRCSGVSQQGSELRTQWNLELCGVEPYMFEMSDKRMTFEE